MQIRTQYKKHCNILKNEIIKTKKQHYHKLIMKASNKAKAAWDIIHRNSRKGGHRMKLPRLNLEIRY